jgi:outer membrane protein
MRKSILCICLAAIAWQADAASLTDVYRLAQQNDAVYASAQAAYRAGMEKLPQGRSLLLPSVNLSANLSRYQTDTNISEPKNFTSPGATLSLTQPLYRKQNLESLAQAKLQVQAVEAQLKLALQSLILRTAQAYFDVLQAEDTLSTTGAQKAAIAQQLAQAKKSFEVGAATIVDTHEAQASFDSTVALEIAAANDLEVKRRTLEKLIKVEAPALDPLAGNVAPPRPQPDDMNAWVRQAEESSLAVAVGQANAEIARREVAKQNAGYQPTLDLAASYGMTNNNVVSGVGGVDSRSAVIGLQLGWNLYQGGATGSLVREAVANQERARFDLEDARRQAALDARQAYLGVISGNARVSALEQVVVSNETQLKSTKLGQEVGVRTAVDVLNAEQQLYGAKRDLAAARYAALISGLNLKAAAGTLSEADLMAVNGLLTKQP